MVWGENLQKSDFYFDPGKVDILKKSQGKAELQHC